MGGGDSQEVEAAAVSERDAQPHEARLAEVEMLGGSIYISTWAPATPGRGPASAIDLGFQHKIDMFLVSAQKREMVGSGRWSGDGCPLSSAVGFGPRPHLRGERDR